MTNIKITFPNDICTDSGSSINFFNMGFDYCHILNGRKLTHVQKMTLQAPFISLFPYSLSSKLFNKIHITPTNSVNKLAINGHTQGSNKAQTNRIPTENSDNGTDPRQCSSFDNIDISQSQNIHFTQFTRTTFRYPRFNSFFKLRETLTPF